MFCDYIGTLVNPWEATISDANVHELQTIWNIVFPHTPHTVAIHDDAVFYLVRIYLYSAFSHTNIYITDVQAIQKMYEWHGHFGEAAVASLTAFWASDRKYDSEQAKEDYVAHALSKGLPFMYADVEENGSSVAIKVIFILYCLLYSSSPPQHMKGSFMSNLIVQTFAIHLTDTDTLSAENKVNDHPRGALVLTVTQ